MYSIATASTLYLCRDAMQEGNLSFADGMMMRSLVNFPGGLELHIGVRTIPLTSTNPAKLQQRCTEQPITPRQGDITMGSNYIGFKLTCRCGSQR